MGKLSKRQIIDSKPSESQRRIEEPTKHTNLSIGLPA
jgi:hypothetical protein